MPEMISSPDFSSEPNFMSQYMPNIARAGVIVNSAFPNLEPGGDVQTLRPPSALSGARVHTPFSGSSSLLSEDSFEHQNPVHKPLHHKLDYTGHLSGHKDPDWEGSRSRPHSRVMFREEDVLREELNDPLLKKLEQLKEIQQQKQEQLKQQQMEQLHKLMEEQKMLLNLVSRQPPYSEHEQQNLPSGRLGGSMSQKHLSCLMSPVSGNIPRDSAQVWQELLTKDRSPTRPPSVSVRELSPKKSKTLEELLNEENTEDYSGDEFESEDSSRAEDSARVLRELHNKNNAEDRPIESGIKERKKSFEEFLEEQMRIEEQRLKHTDLQQAIDEQSKSKPAIKRPFLRRGEGIARFKNAPKKQIKPKEKANLQKVSEVTVPQKVEKVHAQRKIASLSKDQTTLTSGEKNNAIQKKAILKNHNIKHSVPSVIAQGQSGEKTTLSGRRSVTLERKGMLELDKENVDSTKSTEASKPGNKLHDSDTKKVDTAEMSFETSFQKRGVNWEKEKQKEHYELGEFLLLEQAAEDLSFSSNSSFVQKLLDQNFQTDSRRLSSTPVKSAEKAGNSVRTTSGEKMYQKMEVQGSLSKNAPNVLPDRTGKNSSALQRTGNEMKKSHTSDPVSSEGDYASSGDEHNNSLSSENEDVDSEGSMKDEGPNIDQLEGPSKKLHRDSKGRDFDLDLSDGEGNGSKEKTLLAEDSKGDDDSSSSDSSQIVFDDERTWDDLGNVQSLEGVYESNFTTKQFIPSEYTSNVHTDVLDKAITRKVASKNGDQLKAGTISTPDTPPASEFMMKLFPALKPKGKPDGPSVVKPESTQEGQDAVRSQLLKEKLVELETEIERFKMENASLARLREDKEKTLETLRKEVADFEQQKAKELSRIEEYKKEEIKKLQKERKVFEKHASAARAIPDKKEREEIQTLKQQVKDLQEELKKKETKWLTTHVRLRNQIETVVKENGELREEIKFMEKVRVETWKKAETVESRKKISEAPTSQVKRSESVSPLHMLKQRRTSAPEPEKNTKILRSHSPIKSLSSKSFRQMSLSDSSNSEASKVKATEPATSITPQVPDKVLSTEPKIDASLVKDNDDVQGEITYPDGKVERILRNGCHVILFPNGTRKEVSPDGKSTTVTFFNGDVKQVMADQRVIYYYADAQTTHTTYPDGLEILQFSNGQIEKHFPDGKKEITFPDQTIKNLYRDGKEESIFPDGTIITTHPDGTKVIEFDNGQREFHTAQFKRREYPDGTVKTVYTNGQQETKYASGRVRVKDKDGNVIMDTKM
ncbi:centrosomal P4.1-associated protein isoform 1-T2 [Anomaloglossus baeobatrachus]|uniref:centrosomal P4.1-associated protein n=1 Tax=Anomaloglossus baeobatrachus TaxID=238106 RepID=UPI003F50AAAC